KLKVEIGVRKRMAEELMHMKNLKAEALDKERELGELKTRLISMISHEYRTPLTIIMTSTNLIERFIQMEQFGEAFVYLGKIRSTVNLMTQLLEDVLTIGKSDAGKLRVTPVEIELDKLCAELFEELLTIDSKNHVLELESKQTPVLIRTDEMLIKQILTNLISNAMKYSPPNSKIKISLELNSRSVLISVADSGIGIPKDDMNKLFETFHRGSNTGTISGTGLGLAIVKRCVHALRGEIDFESELYSGTSFTVRIPANMQ
ncbi:MAG: sensor histidine kinase, partial [Candidatus Kapaibacterium sp.]